MNRAQPQPPDTGPQHLPIVGVMGSGRDAHAELAAPLGHWLATQRVHLLTGGGGGVMAAVSRAFAKVQTRSGHVIGILPGSESGDRLRQGYPNPWVEIPIRTHLPLSGTQGTNSLSRNHINILTANAIVALPGGAGTASEVRLAVAYARPIIAFVHSTADIPHLPTEIPITTALGQVKTFVLQTCRPPDA